MRPLLLGSQSSRGGKTKLKLFSLMYILNNFSCCTDFPDPLALSTQQLPDCKSFYMYFLIYFLNQTFPEYFSVNIFKKITRAVELAAGDFTVMLQVTTKVSSLCSQMYLEYFLNICHSYDTIVFSSIFICKGFTYMSLIKRLNIILSNLERPLSSHNIRKCSDIFRNTLKINT
jgi:hypothetical protein